MIHSIRIKLFASFIAILVLFQLIFLIANTYFLDDIFVWGNKRIMSNLYAEFKSRLDKGYDEEELIHELNSNFDGNISIIDMNLRTIYSTYSRFSRGRLAAILSEMVIVIKKGNAKAYKDSFSFISPNGQPRFRSIVFVGKLPDNRFFIIEKPFGIVSESSRIAELFIIISGIGTIILGSIIVYFLSARLTKPIISINNVAKEIANLNFNEKLKITSKDELGTLASNINLISDQLSQTLGELTEANSILKEDIEKERSLEKMRRQFVSSVSHELKTPISMIQGHADGLKFNIAKNPEDMEFYCDVIIDESAKMSCLIKDLLDLSAYESGSFTIVKSHFDFTELLKTAAEKYKKVLAERNIELELAAPDECLVNADKLRMEQVISNFMSNGERHVEDNGRIRMTLECLPSSAKLKIFNTGSGIKARDVENIWTSFYKVESARRNSGEGTGLGLAIVKAIVELHNGSYGVENKEDGVEFWIEIPV